MKVGSVGIRIGQWDRGDSNSGAVWNRSAPIVNLERGKKATSGESLITLKKMCYRWKAEFSRLSPFRNRPIKKSGVNRCSCPWVRCRQRLSDKCWNAENSSLRWAPLSEGNSVVFCTRSFCRKIAAVKKAIQKLTKKCRRFRKVIGKG